MEHVDVSKCTPGPARIEQGGGHAPGGVYGFDMIHTNGRQRNSLGISSASYSDCICEFPSDLSLPGPAANAALIKEAWDVAAETGLSPRQLAEQRIELLKACKPVLEELQAWIEGQSGPLFDPDQQNIEWLGKVIARVSGQETP